MKNLSVLLLFVLVSASVFSQKAERLFVVDGTFIQPAKEELVNKIPAEQIETLVVLNSNEAISKYGDFLGNKGIVFIKTKYDAARPIDIPKDARLTYGNKKPVAILNGKIVDFDKIDQLTTGSIVSLQVDRNNDFLDKYGPQSINGVVTITTR